MHCERKVILKWFEVKDVPNVKLFLSDKYCRKSILNLILMRGYHKILNEKSIRKLETLNIIIFDLLKYLTMYFRCDHLDTLDFFYKQLRILSRTPVA